MFFEEEEQNVPQNFNPKHMNQMSWRLRRIWGHDPKNVSCHNFNGDRNGVLRLFVGTIAV